MKDIGASIRAIYSALLTGITYGGAGVPFYDEEPLVSTPDHYIVLLGITQIPDNNDQHFVSNAIVTLDIVSKANMQISRAAVDNISGQILEILLPQAYVDRTDADFQVMIRDVTSPGYVRAQKGSIHIIRKILNFNNHLIQKQ
jgi:hypothetical protein